jgi:hypothetical protein
MLSGAGGSIWMLWDLVQENCILCRPMQEGQSLVCVLNWEETCLTVPLQGSDLLLPSIILGWCLWQVSLSSSRPTGGIASLRQTTDFYPRIPSWETTRSVVRWPCWHNDVAYTMYNRSMIISYFQKWGWKCGASLLPTLSMTNNSCLPL